MIYASTDPNGILIQLDNGEFIIRPWIEPVSNELKELVEKQASDTEILDLLENFKPTLIKELLEFSKNNPKKVQIKTEDQNVIMRGITVPELLIQSLIMIQSENQYSVRKIHALLAKTTLNPDDPTLALASRWLTPNHDIEITTDGDVLWYKGVREDGLSENRGYGVVNGKIIQHDRLDNFSKGVPGNIIEYPRDHIDNRNNQCGTGLHVSHAKFARSFGFRLLQVKFNPADVVVASEANPDKIRVCKYTVMKEII